MAAYVIPSAATELLDNLEIEADNESEAREQALETFKQALEAFGLIKDETGEDNDD